MFTEMNKEVLERVNANKEIGEDGFMRYSRTGEEFVTMTSSGLCMEGCSVDKLYLLPQEACNEFVARCDELYKDSFKDMHRNVRIFWRRKPEVREIKTQDGMSYYTVRARILMTQKEDIPINFWNYALSEIRNSDELYTQNNYRRDL